MNRELVGLNYFALFTFATTSHALKAEKVLQKNEAEFLIIPTLREISASCGLSIKMHPENQKRFFNLLSENQVQIEGAYLVEKQKRQNKVATIDFKSLGDYTE